MIRREALGQLRDGAAGLAALSELFASRRVGPKAVAAALGPAIDACTSVENAARFVADDTLAAIAQHPKAVAEVRAMFDRAIEKVRALRSEAMSARRGAVDARARLSVERTAYDAYSHIAAGLFTGELLAAATAPKKVSVRVVDVLGFGPLLPEGPLVVVATLDVPTAPVVTTDARLLRGLVELCAQIIAASGVARPHIEVAAGADSGASIRVSAPRSSSSIPPPSSRRSGSSPPRLPVLTIRKLPWDEGAEALVRATATMGGVKGSIDPARRVAMLDVP